MPTQYYRFWSMDPVYRKITNLVGGKGAKCPTYGELSRDMRLFEGDVYEFGLALGRKFPEKSFKIVGLNPEPTESFPAALMITTESGERLMELEKKYGLDKISQERREILHPDVPWEAGKLRRRKSSVDQSRKRLPDSSARS